MPLDEKQVARIRRLHANGTSNREIAETVGCARNTVRKVINGLWHPPGTRRRTEEEEPVGPPKRCPGCGGLVYMPCRLCKIRERMNDAKREVQSER